MITITERAGNHLENLAKDTNKVNINNKLYLST